MLKRFRLLVEAADLSVEYGYISDCSVARYHEQSDLYMLVWVGPLAIIHRSFIARSPEICHSFSIITRSIFGLEEHKKHRFVGIFQASDNFFLTICVQKKIILFLPTK